MKLQKIKINEENNTEEVIATYLNIKEATKDIKSKASEFAIQLNIALAILHNTKAYQYKWKYVK